MRIVKLLQLRLLDTSSPDVRYVCNCSKEYKRWLNAPHQFVDTVRLRLRRPVPHVDTVTAEAMAVGTAAPPTLRIRPQRRVGAPAGAVVAYQAAVPAQVGRAFAQLSCTPLHRCNPSRQSVRLLKECLYNSRICATDSCVTHGLTSKVQPRT